MNTNYQNFLTIKAVRANSQGEQEEVGFANYNIRNCELTKIAVYREFQRQGIGTKLFQAAMDQLHDNGCSSMHWESYPSSVPFYLKQGAKLTGKKNSEGCPEMSIDIHKKIG